MTLLQCRLPKSSTLAEVKAKISHDDFREDGVQLFFLSEDTTYPDARTPLDEIPASGENIVLSVVTNRMHAQLSVVFRPNDWEGMLLLTAHAQICGSQMSPTH